MRLQYSDAAREQLNAIGEYIGHDSPIIARIVLSRIRAAANRLTTFPQSAPKGSAPKTREMTVRGLPYVIVYELRSRPKSIMVLNVFHAAQDR